MPWLSPHSACLWLAALFVAVSVVLGAGNKTNFDISPLPQTNNTDNSSKSVEDRSKLKKGVLLEEKQDKTTHRNADLGAVTEETNTSSSSHPGTKGNGTTLQEKVTSNATIRNYEDKATSSSGQVTRPEETTPESNSPEELNHSDHTSTPTHVIEFSNHNVTTQDPRAAAKLNPDADTSEDLHPRTGSLPEEDEDEGTTKFPTESQTQNNDAPEIGQRGLFSGFVNIAKKFKQARKPLVTVHKEEHHVTNNITNVNNHITADSTRGQGKPTAVEDGTGAGGEPKAATVSQVLDRLLPVIEERLSHIEKLLKENREINLFVNVHGKSVKMKNATLALKTDLVDGGEEKADLESEITTELTSKENSLGWATSTAQLPITIQEQLEATRRKEENRAAEIGSTPFLQTTSQPVARNATEGGVTSKLRFRDNHHKTIYGNRKPLNSSSLVEQRINTHFKEQDADYEDGDLLDLHRHSNALAEDTNNKVKQLIAMFSNLPKQIQKINHPKRYSTKGEVYQNKRNRKQSVGGFKEDRDYHGTPKQRHNVRSSQPRADERKTANKKCHSNKVKLNPPKRTLSEYQGWKKLKRDKNEDE